MLVLLSIFWGLSFPLIKSGLQFSSPILFVFARFLFTTALYLLIFYNQVRKIKFSDFRYGVILGVFLFLGFITQTIGLKFTTASKSAFVTGANIVLIPFAQYFIIKKKPAVANIVGIILVLIGLYLLTELQEMAVNIGDLITFFCSISFSIYVVLLDKYSRLASFHALVFGQFLTTTVFSLLASFFVENLIFRETQFIISTELIVIILLNAVIGTLIGLFVSTRYQKEITPVRAGLIYNLELPSAVLFSYFLLGEIMSISQWLGASIMVIGLIISELFSYFNKTTYSINQRDENHKD